eukprot:TRINITY_DN27689_c0_g1_i2.p1 TRINITY_DN27689_c0_g1~~TRINITY_DN27689_c0_g1_i2.p1  ORF type:complete len:676 (-),score=152.23 TRINITY_DN27689_c0_g1_i2:251-2278(-)
MCIRDRCWLLVAPLLLCVALGAPVSTSIPTVTVDIDAVTHQISELAMGCHSDSGYAHQARGFYSQMIVGSSFNSTGYADGRWNYESDAVFDLSTDADGMYGTPSERVTFSSGSGGMRLSNRGLGNAGLVFEAGKEYEGYMFAKPGGSEPVSLEIGLRNYETGASLGSTVLAIANTGRDHADANGFVRYNFTFNPTASTGCHDIIPADEPEVSCGKSAVGAPSVGHTCVKCSGEFYMALTGPPLQGQSADLLVNYVFLQPGAWGRVGGLSVLASAANTLKAMGVKAIRQGGSFASSPSGKGNSEYYQWQKWTGPAWKRASRSDGVWANCLLSGWGPFEMIDMCNALEIQPIITTTDTSSPADFADLVEYCYGDASTAMGAQRVADGHPETYNVNFFELGNEEYNANYVEQVTAMQAKATEIGKTDKMYYMFPNNNFLNSTDMAKASQLSPRIDDQLLADIHIGGGGAVEAATTLFASHGDFKMGAVNAETNAGTHVFSRAMSEATDLNDWFNAAAVADRLHFRAASFCMGDSTDFDNWDQGISFFLPNMTWLQPPGYVHQMVAQSWQPNALSWAADSVPATVFSAQKSDDDKIVVLRYANTANETATMTVNLMHGGKPVDPVGDAKVSVLSSADPNAANPPGDPARVSPKSSRLALKSGTMVQFAPNSYTVIEITM